MTREMFRHAVAEAAIGIVNVYAEVDKLMRELGVALAAQDGRFAQFGGRVVPGVKKNPDARYLRNYVAGAYTPGGTGDEADEVDEDADDPDAESDGEDVEDDEPKKSRKPLALAVGDSILIARVAIYQRGVVDFEPNLRIGVLTNCRVDSSVEKGTVLRIPRNRFRGMVRAFVTHQGPPGKPLRTMQLVQVEAGGKNKPRHRLVFDMPEVPLERPLFEMTPASVRDVAAAVQASWQRLVGG